MDSALEYMLSGVHELLWPRPIVPGAQAAASRSPVAGNAYPLLRDHGCVWLEARVLPRVEEGGRTVRQTVKSCLSTHIIGWKKCKRELLLGLVLFGFVAPPLRSRVVGLYLIGGVWFLSHLLLEGSGRIQNFEL
jgi:hypothetical protein